MSILLRHVCQKLSYGPDALRTYPQPMTRIVGTRRSGERSPHPDESVEDEEEGSEGGTSFPLGFPSPGFRTNEGPLEHSFLHHSVSTVRRRRGIRGDVDG